jgi:cysteine desulfurase / selenocysteine lyase
MDDRTSLRAFRDDFPSLQRRRREKPPVYLDNACTTLVPRQVIAALDEYYSDYPSCGGRRSQHWFAEEVTRRIEGSAEPEIKGTRQAIAELINAESKDEIVFTSNTTHAINAVALGLRLEPGDVVLLTDREHNSNLLPWLRLQASGLIEVDHTVPDPEDDFDLEEFASHLREKRVRLVSMAYTSNVTGATLPAREIIATAHRHGARVLLDGAQTVPHQAVDVRALDVDFLAFSLHKMCGPRGVGVLYARRELLGRGAREWEAGNDVIEPVILGGGTVDDTTYDSYRLLEGPERFEAGIPDYAGLVAAGAAVQYVRGIGMERIRAHEERLNAYLTEKLRERYGDTGWFTILGPREASRRGGILTFEVRRPNAVGIATELDAKMNIMIRDGAFCVHSYFNERFGPNWIRPRSHRDHRMVYRVSLYLYNTVEECDLFLETLDEIFKERSYV